MLEEMMAEDEEKPGAIEKFKEREETIDQLVETTRVEHTDIYQEIVNEHLRDEDTGRVDYGRLDETDIQEEVIEKMTQEYLSRAQERLGAGKPETEVEEDIILQRYFGTTKSQLEKRIKQHGSDYTLQRHENQRDRHVQELERELRPLSVEHMSDEEIEDVVEYVEDDAKEIIERAKKETEIYDTSALVKTHPRLLREIIKYAEDSESDLNFDYQRSA